MPQPVSSTSKIRKLLSLDLILSIIFPLGANFKELVIKFNKIYNNFYLSELINPLLNVKT